MLTSFSTRAGGALPRPKAAQGSKIPSAKISPATNANNHDLTACADAVTTLPVPGARSLKKGLEAVFVRRVSGKELKAFRVQFHISARGMAQMTGYSRPYIKRVEGGSLRASAKFSEKFFAVRADWANVPAPAPKALTVVGPGTLPEDVLVLVLMTRPRRCKAKRCHACFVPRDRRQKFCSDACRAVHARGTRKAK